MRPGLELLLLSWVVSCSEPSSPATDAPAQGSGGVVSAGGPAVSAAAGSASAGTSTSSIGGTEAASTAGSAGLSAGGAPGGAGQGGGGAAPEPYVPISFGTQLDPAVQIAASQELARSLANPSSPGWRAKGDQRRTYPLPGADREVAYRVCVPNDWDGASALPLVMFLHGANNDESSYLDQNAKQMVGLAEQHGYLLVSPLGYEGAYGNFLRLPADFGSPDEAAKMLANRTAQDEARQQLSEQDVINVLELVLNEYPIDESRMFLTGHSMGSGGTWYIGGKYASYWAALAPMSGPFVLEHGYPWENLRDKPVLVTEGLSAATVSGSRAVRDWMMEQGFAVSYQEVAADHAGMVPVVLPDVFAFFDQSDEF